MDLGSIILQMDTVMKVLGMKIENRDLGLIFSEMEMQDLESGIMVF